MIGRSTIRVAPGYQPLLREIGIDGDSVFEDSRIQCWRDIRERQNCILDETLPDNRRVRLHIKRFKKPGDRGAEDEARGIRLLQERGIPTTPLVAWGCSAAGRGFVITDDLGGYQDAEQAVRAGMPLDKLLAPVGALAARLHGNGLHHRDLYLCHFFVRMTDNEADLRLIDAARVRELPRWFSRRWIIKDLAQLVFSLRQVGATPAQEEALFSAYAPGKQAAQLAGVRRRIERKVRRIERHDRRLRARQPERHVSLPQ